MKFNQKNSTYVRHALPILTGLSVVLTLTTACTTQQGTQSNTLGHFRAPTSEALLAAEDSTTGIKGYKGLSLSPLQMHAMAKKQVNPNKTSGRLAYTKHPKKSDVMASVGTRVLKLEQQNMTDEVATFALAEINSTLSAPAIPSPAQKPAALATVSDTHVQIAALDVPARKPVPIKDMITAVEATAGVTKSHLNVVNLRLGDYEDKTRLVIDLNAAAKYDYDISNTNNILTVHLDGAGWSLQEQQQFENHPLIKSYHIARGANNDTTLQFELKRPSRMLMSGTVHPDKNRGHRIFFDVAAL
jgi:hypothetical protein